MYGFWEAKWAQINDKIRLLQKFYYNFLNLEFVLDFTKNKNYLEAPKEFFSAENNWFVDPIFISFWLLALFRIVRNSKLSNIEQH